jgi:molybdopterin-guanine dinucleotide biosynthesis protein A
MGISTLDWASIVIYLLIMMAIAIFFDAENDFKGCIPGIHEALRRQGLLEGNWCLDAAAEISPGQSEEIDRVCRAYPDMNDDAFVRKNLDRWLNE